MYEAPGPHLYHGVPYGVSSHNASTIRLGLRLPCHKNVIHMKFASTRGHLWCALRTSKERYLSAQRLQ